jgi:NRAMP (natural resistance-associated macrophage protein)-like metal ion transporter
MPNTKSWWSPVRKFLQKIGPGFVTGAADDDPSGIATYSQTGAQFGYTQLWAALFAIPFMISIQEMCGRIGLVTGKGIAGIMRRHFSKKLLYGALSILLIANVINIGANLGAMAEAVTLFIPGSFSTALLSITALTLFLIVLVPYKVYTKYLKYLTVSLFAYVGATLIVKQDWAAILHSTFIPSFSWEKDYLMNLVALFGTSISPYLFFWQASQEVEEAVASNKLRTMGIGTPQFTRKDVRALRADTIFGMVFSNLIAFFIIATAASTLHLQGITQIETAPQAAAALRPLAGDFAFLLFALGIIGTGFLAVPVLAGSASYALSEAFGWREGLYRTFKKAPGFYGIIIVATVLGLGINYLGVKPFSLLYYTAVLNGICAPPLMVVILLISNSKQIMGKYKNSFISNLSGWIITLLMSAASIFLLWQVLLGN